MEKSLKITVGELLSVLKIDTPVKIVIDDNGWRKVFKPDPVTYGFGVEKEYKDRLVDRCHAYFGEDNYGNPDGQVTIFLR